MTHLLWSGNVGGIERLVHDLASEQHRQGLDVTVAFGRGEGPFFEALRATDLRVLDLRLTSGHALRMVRHVASTWRSAPPDILHMHGYNFAFDALARSVAQPIVFTEHGNFGLGRTLGPAEKLKHRLKGRFLRTVAKIAANSVHTAQRAAALYGLDFDTVTVIHNGVRIPAGEPDATDPRNEELRVAFVGRLVPFKRPQLLLEAAARTGIRDRVRVDFVGGGPLEEDLRRLVHQLRLDERVRFLGYRDPAATLRVADVLVQPSKEEPFGLVIVEAAARGVLPIVFSDAGGALEVLPPDGIVVRDVADLAQVLIGLLGSPLLEMEARHRRAAWVSRTFDISRTSRCYLELYQAAALTK